MRKWEIALYTEDQIWNALDRSDPNDPHAGQVEIRDMADFEALFEDED